MVASGQAGNYDCETPFIWCESLVFSHSSLDIPSVLLEQMKIPRYSTQMNRVYAGDAGNVEMKLDYQDESFHNNR